MENIMSDLFCYRGRIDTFYDDPNKPITIKPEFNNDGKTAPLLIYAYPALLNYIKKRSNSNAKERNMVSDFYYNDQLYLERIEFQGDKRLNLSIFGKTKYIPAKIIACVDANNKDVKIFGSSRYIDVDKPNSMDRLDYIEFKTWNKVNKASKKPTNEYLEQTWDEQKIEDIKKRDWEGAYECALQKDICSGKITEDLDMEFLKDIIKIHGVDFPIPVVIRTMERRKGYDGSYTVELLSKVLMSKEYKEAHEKNPRGYVPFSDIR